MVQNKLPKALSGTVALQMLRDREQAKIAEEEAKTKRKEEREQHKREKSEVKDRKRKVREENIRKKQEARRAGKVSKQETNDFIVLLRLRQRRGFC
ncbi:hypothetical protein DPMN_061024 [Dreissena polymorpha]|uniref:Uncharacterized protein n=1 Tax=Dreissena polymorpha TaxID=45954 RepID=A0A9D4C6X3_DREPO|nr:hypothetical protein DPMN_061024 [Dreissena polymorpha]